MYRSTEAFRALDALVLTIPRGLRCEQRGYRRSFQSCKVSGTLTHELFVHYLAENDGFVDLADVGVKVAKREATFAKGEPVTKTFDAICVFDLETDMRNYTDLSVRGVSRGHLRRALERGEFSNTFFPSEYLHMRAPDALQKALDCDIVRGKELKHVIRDPVGNPKTIIYRTVGQLLIVLDLISLATLGEPFTTPLTLFLRLIFSKSLMNVDDWPKLDEIVRRGCQVCLYHHVCKDTIFCDSKGLYWIPISTGGKDYKNAARMDIGADLTSLYYVSFPYLSAMSLSFLSVPFCPMGALAARCGKGEHRFQKLNKPIPGMRFGTHPVSAEQYNMFRLIAESLRTRMLSTDLKGWRGTSITHFSASWVQEFVPDWLPKDFAQRADTALKCHVQVGINAWRNIAGYSRYELIQMIRLFPAKVSGALDVMRTTSNAIAVIPPKAQWVQREDGYACGFSRAQVVDDSLPGSEAKLVLDCEQADDLLEDAVRHSTRAFRQVVPELDLAEDEFEDVEPGLEPAVGFERGLEENNLRSCLAQPGGKKDLEKQFINRDTKFDHAAPGDRRFVANAKDIREREKREAAEPFPSLYERVAARRLKRQTEGAKRGTKGAARN